MRGTTNRNARGGSKARRARREWLVKMFAANVRGFDGEIVCRCYRCATLLSVATVTVDRIIPGCRGGTYRRNNIRPACAVCNSETGGGLRR